MSQMIKIDSLKERGIFIAWKSCLYTLLDKALFQAGYYKFFACRFVQTDMRFLSRFVTFWLAEQIGILEH